MNEDAIDTLQMKISNVQHVIGKFCSIYIAEVLTGLMDAWALSIDAYNTQGLLYLN